MKKILFGLSIMVLVSCGNENARLTDVDRSTKSQFQWDFGKPKKIIYSFSQTVNGENKMAKDDPAEKNHMVASGHLNVRVKENNLADLSLTDINMTLIDFEEDGTPVDTITQEVPPNVVQDMKSDGSFDHSISDLQFGILFPLPKKSLEKGESDHYPMKMPFNIKGSHLFAKGQINLTFTGYKEMEGRNCVTLEGDIDISELNVPEELKGEYKCSTTGNGTYYFDLVNGYYVGADIQLTMHVMMNTATDNDDEFGSYIEMKSDNVYKIRLEKIEE